MTPFSINKNSVIIETLSETDKSDTKPARYESFAFLLFVGTENPDNVSLGTGLYAGYLIGVDLN